MDILRHRAAELDRDGYMSMTLGSLGLLVQNSVLSDCGDKQEQKV